jgi:hypothetical protein
MNTALEGLQAIVDFRAPKNEGGNVVFRDYKEGDHIQARKFNRSDVPSNHVEAYKTDDGYLIPLSNVYVLGTIEEATPIEQQVQEEPIQEAEVVTDNVIPTPAPPTNTAPATMIDNLKSRNKSAVNGSLIGGLAGVVFAMVKGKNKMMAGAIGAAIGFAAGNMYHKFSNK